MGRKPRKINPEMPATAISFDKEMLKLLKRVADADDRSLASLVRLAVDSWLKSPEGLKMTRKAKRPETAEKRVSMGDEPTSYGSLLTNELISQRVDAPEVAEQVEEPTKAELLARIEKLEAQAAAKGKI